MSYNVFSKLLPVFSFKIKFSRDARAPRTLIFTTRRGGKTTTGDVGDFVSDGTFGWLRAPLLMQSCFGPMIEYYFARLLSSAREFVSAISIPQNFSKFSAFHHQFNSFLS
jgi:hypothetical protein